MIIGLILSAVQAFIGQSAIPLPLPKENIPQQVTTLSSDDFQSLFFEYWPYHAFFHNDHMYLMFPGRRNEGFMSKIIRFKNGAPFKDVYVFTARENMSYALGFSFDSRKSILAMTPSMGNVLMLYDLVNDPRRMATVPNHDTMAYVNGKLHFGRTFPEPRIFDGEENEPDYLKKINRDIQKAFVHPIDGISDSNKLVVAVTKKQLAVTSQLSQKVLIFDPQSGDLLKTIALVQLFPGYIAADPNFDINPEALDFRVKWKKWLTAFHRIEKLRFDGQGRLFANLRKGYEGRAVWALIDNYPSTKWHWDNNVNHIKLLNITQKKLLFGTTEETEAGEITWQLWLQDY